jgi:hypothetical protein
VSFTTVPVTFTFDPSAGNSDVETEIFEPSSCVSVNPESFPIFIESELIPLRVTSLPTYWSGVSFICLTVTELHPATSRHKTIKANIVFFIMCAIFSNYKKIAVKTANMKKQANIYKEKS